jgi:hypothetical protein
MNAMPWGAKMGAVLSLRIAAGASILFWLGLLFFVAAELAFDGASPPWWLEPLDDALIFTVWSAACVATGACILAMRRQGHPLARHPGNGVEPVRNSGAASPGQGGQCSAL